MGAITVTLQTAAGGKIDEGAYTVQTLFKKSYIRPGDGFKVTAMDVTAGKYPVTYTFEVTPKSKVVKDSYLVV